VATPYGRALLHSGLAAFDELRRGVQEIEFLSDPTAGEVRIGATEPMVVGLLPAVISDIGAYRSMWCKRPRPPPSTASCANAPLTSSSDAWRLLRSKRT
jgi:hypothetical protein